jgi:tRNA(adenine34) deaminase
MKNHEYFMGHCLRLAGKAMATGNPPVGAIIVKDEKIIGRGIEACEPEGDSTRHAEIEAVRNAVKKLNRTNLSDCSLYTTHEPCIMCSYVIRHHAIGEVVIGIRVKAIGGISSNYPILIAKDMEIWSAPPRIVENVCSQECKALTQQYEQQG